MSMKFPVYPGHREILKDRVPDVSLSVCDLLQCVIITAADTPDGTKYEAVKTDGCLG